MSEQHVFIRMQDGIRLAATLFLPDVDEKVPALLEARPYRKDDASPGHSVYRRLRDEGRFGVVRVDIRGTGSSQGIAEDEYSFQERRDLVAVLDWIAKQPWCTGSVGMFGWSYSGFNSLQIAMERPRPLKAICALFAADDRYTDDVHYQGGIRHALDFVDYPLFMVAMNALPPVPAIIGDDWREEWRVRLEHTEPWMFRWLEEQNDSTYWRYGSVRPRYDQIKVPTFIVGGWADGYRTSAVRLFEKLRCEKRLLLGPWSHMDPVNSTPGPRADVIPVLIRWFNHTLRSRDEALANEPPITLFMRRSTAPEPDLDAYRGEWRFEQSWPPVKEDRVLPLTDAIASAPLGILETRGDVGWTASIWCAAHLPFGPPFDQRPDEVHSLVFDWPALAEELAILGVPRAQMVVRASEPVTFLSVKLCDVAPDGSSAMVARGVLNLTHRDSHTEPSEVEAGERYRIRLDLDATSWIFEPGHRVRLDVAGSDWPNVWPPPTPGRITLDQDASSLVLPVVEPPAPDAPIPVLPPGDEHGEREDPPPEWGTSEDVLTRERVVWIAHAHARDEPDSETAPVRVSYAGEAGVSLADPGIAWAEGRVSYEIEWPEVTVGSDAHGRLESDADTWHLLLELKAREGDEVIHVRRWEKRFPRKLQ